METSYITTIIPYVNDKPHLGHSLLFTYADVIARYQRQKGRDVVFATGTDEHGGKIEEKAAAAGLGPKEFADGIVLHFKDALEKLNISYNRFVRTTDLAHEQRAQIIWQNLAEYIYLADFEGWYCVGCEAYKTDTLVKDNSGVCPDHNREYVKLKEQNYFFKLTALSDQVLQKIESNELNIVPKTRRNEVLSMLKDKDGLQDISISRPKDKLSWGIPVPGDAGHVMYVWFEALMNYITVLGYPEHEDFDRYWPANIQVLGKDIAKFHAIIWPAMLIGLGLEPPKSLYVHGFITSGGKKMGKSLGNAIDPLEVIEKYGLDPFRYYLLRHIPSHSDGDFTFEKFEAAYNGELANDLGNAVSRVAAMIGKYQENVIGEVKSEIHDLQEFESAVDDFRFDKAMDLIWQRVQQLNKYIEVEKPWEIAKTDAEHLQEVLAYAASSLLEIASMLQPFMPSTSDKISHIFESGVVRPLDAPLFPRLERKPT